MKTKQYISHLLLATLLGAPLVSTATLIDFGATAYPTVPLSLTNGAPLLDANGDATNFVYVGQNSNTGTVTTGHYLSMTTGSEASSTSWVKDSQAIAFSGAGAQDIYRSVSFNVSAMSGTSSTLTIGLLTSSLGTGNAINTTTGFILAVSAVPARNQFRILRQTSTGAEYWTGSSWSTDNNNYVGSFSIDTNYQVVMSFDVDAGVFSLSLIDLDTNSVQATASTNIASLSSTATTDGALRMAAGDPYSNIGTAWTTNITEISTVPEPAQMGIGLGVLVLLASLIVRSRRQ